MPEKTNENFPPAVVRTLQIFELLSSSPQPLGIKDVSEAIGIPHTSAYRIMRCLTQNGYLTEQSPNAERYSLGYKFSVLASKADLHNHLINIASKEMVDLSEKTNQSVLLGVCQNNGVVVIKQEISKGKVSVVMTELHEIMPVNNNALGKVLVAFLPAHESKKYIEESWTEVISPTTNAPIEKEQFYRELEQIRQTGFSTDIAEFNIGVGCFAVPIFDFSGEVLAALAVTGSLDYYVNLEESDLLPHLISSGKNISHLLGYRE